MDRISTITKVLDLFGVGKPGLRDGDLGLGVAPTALNAEWFNGVQEELLSIIEGAGIVPSAVTRNQILTALRGSGLFLTPAQFDASQKAATTAFVRTAGLHAGGTSYYTSSNTLPPTDVGKLVLANFAAPGGTLSLPALAGLPASSVIMLHNWGNNDVGLAPQVGEVINSNAGNVPNFILKAGSTLMLMSENTTTSWIVVGGSAQLTTSPLLDALLATNGYFRHPRGFFVQKGRINLAFANTFSNFTFPIAFPTSAGNTSVIVTPVTSSTSGAKAWHDTPTGSLVPVAADVAGPVDVIAIGF